MPRRHFMSRVLLFGLVSSILLALVSTQAGAATASAPATAIAMHGTPALPHDFAVFPYVNPDAPKGGRVTIGSLGSFDSLNPLIVRGEPVQGMREFVFESLMTRSQDEPFTLYGLLAETIDVPDDRSQVTFNLNPLARFSDGAPVTADDVLFSFEVLRDKGRPNYRTYYKKVAKTERLSDHSVRFVLAGADRELPLILGLMPILPKHLFSAETFEQTSLKPPVGSGPYRVGRIDPGRSITYERDPGYWARDLPVSRGRFNFDQIRFEYYRDSSTLFEAFKSGAIDVRNEDDPAQWAQGYTFPAATDGRVVKADLPVGLPAGMTGLVFNTRRAVFADPRVRAALIELFNFEWVNKSLYNGLYKRTQSYFERSILSSASEPAGERERALLAPFPDSVKAAILSGTYRMPESDGTGHNRNNARKASALLASAGYALVNGRLLKTATGQPLEFEILASTSSQERLLASFTSDLARLGIAARIRMVDSAQYQARLKDYDYDMMQFTWPASLSPGNEQLFRWSSKVGKEPGSYNYAGVENPAADAMIAAILSADGQDEFVATVHALDRVLLSGDYVIPLFHAPAQWLAYWSHLARPEKTPLFGFNIDTWWSKRPN
ncbi:MAG: extracellular solute-binding protein [Hyphomicrobium sp.]